ncbi:MAG: hypothetical protein WAN55_08815, partial [Halobacteriota archaeon]
MIAGYPTTHASNYNELSKGYKCRYIKVGNMGGRMSIHKRIKTQLTLAARKKVILHLISPLEKTTHEICHAVHALAPSRREKMLTKALVLTDDEAELLSRAL